MVDITVDFPKASRAQVHIGGLGEEASLRLEWGAGGGAFTLPLLVGSRRLDFRVKGKVELAGRLGRIEFRGPFPVPVWDPRVQLAANHFEVTNLAELAEEIVRTLPLAGDDASGVWAQIRGAIEAFLGEVDDVLDELLRRIPDPIRFFGVELRPRQEIAARVRQHRAAIRASIRQALSGLAGAIALAARRLLEAREVVRRSTAFVLAFVADPREALTKTLTAWVADLERCAGAVVELLGAVASQRAGLAKELIARTLERAARLSTSAWPAVERLLEGIWTNTQWAAAELAAAFESALAAALAASSAGWDLLGKAGAWLLKKLQGGGQDLWELAARVTREATARIVNVPTTLGAWLREFLGGVASLARASVESLGRFLARLENTQLALAVCRVLRESRALFDRLLAGTAAALEELWEALGVVTGGLDLALPAPLRRLEATFAEVRRLPAQSGVALEHLDAFRTRLGGGPLEVTAALLGELQDALRGEAAPGSLGAALTALEETLAALVQTITGEPLPKGAPLGEDDLAALARAIDGARDALQATTSFLAGATRSEPTTIRCAFRRLRIAEFTAGGAEGVEVEEAWLPDLLQGAAANRVAELLRDVLGIEELGVLQVQAFAARLETPAPTETRTAGYPLDHEERRGARLDRLPPLPTLLALDFLPTLRVALAGRFFPIDPRYATGYGDSLQLRLADLDGDGKVEAWEVARARGSLGEPGGAFDVDRDGKVTLEDLELILAQAALLVNGVPYKEAAAPFGLHLDWPDGSWLWLSATSLADEDIGLDGARVNRTGGGLFLHGQLNLPTTLRWSWTAGAGGEQAHYPLRFQLGWRLFADRFPKTGLTSFGTSTHVVVRGGEEGNDWQLRARLNVLPGAVPTPPPLTRNLTLGFLASLGAHAAYAVAGRGNLKLGLQYEGGSTIVESLTSAAELAEDVLADPLRLIEHVIGLLDPAPFLAAARRLVAPWLALWGFDLELEGALMLAEGLLSWRDEGFDDALASLTEQLLGARGPSGIEGLATGWTFDPAAPVPAAEAEFAQAAAERERLSREQAEARATLTSVTQVRAERRELLAKRRALEAERQTKQATLARMSWLDLGRTTLQLEIQRLSEQLARLPAAATLEQELAALERSQREAEAVLAAAPQRLARLEEAVADAGREAHLRARCRALLTALAEVAAWDELQALRAELAAARKAGDAARVERLQAEEKARAGTPTPSPAAIDDARRFRSLVAPLAARVQKRETSAEKLTAAEGALTAARERLAKVEAQLAEVEREHTDLRRARADVEHRRQLEKSLGMRGLLRGPSRAPTELDRQAAALDERIAACAARRASLEQERRAAEEQVSAAEATAARRRAEAAAEAARTDSPLDAALLEAWRALGRAERIALWKEHLADVRLDHYLAELGEGVRELVELLLQGKPAQAFERLERALQQVSFRPEDARNLGDAALSLVQFVQAFLAVARGLADVSHAAFDPSAQLASILGLADGPTEFDVFRPLGRELTGRRDRVAEEAEGSAGADRGAGDEGQASSSKEGAIGLFAFGEDKLSLLWALDAGAGAGAGAEAAGAGAEADLTAGAELHLGKLSFPIGLLVDLRAVQVFVRLVLKLLRQLARVLGKAQAYFAARPQLTFTHAVEAAPRLYVWYLLALVEALRELMRDEADWVAAFLSACTLEAVLTVEVEGSATGAAVGVEGEYEIGLVARVTLADLLDPLITLLERAGPDLPPEEGKALLSERIVPTIEVRGFDKVSGTLKTVGLQLNVASEGTFFVGDFSLPDGSPWRAKLDDLLEGIVDAVYFSLEEATRAPTPSASALQGVETILDLLDRVVAGTISPFEVPLPRLATPSALRVEQALRGAPSDYAADRGQLEAVLAALRRVGARPRHTPEGLAPTGPGERQGRVALAAFFSDAEEAALASVHAGSAALEDAEYVLRVGAGGILRAVYNAFDGVSGFACGFETYAAAKAFCAARPAGWVEAPEPAASVWDVAGQWYAWLHTGLDERCLELGLPIPALAVDEGGRAVRLRFEHVPRGAADALGLERAGSDPYRRVTLLADAMPGAAEELRAFLWGLEVVHA